MKLFYQEHSLKPGIYKILNTHSLRTYVGQAKEFKSRWRGHCSSLLAGKHQNKFIQADFNKCQEELGHTNFLEFHVIEVMEGSSKEERNKREEEHIALIWESKLPDGTRVCYNFKEKTEAKDRSCFSNSPEETRKKQSKIQKEIHSNPARREADSKRFKEMWAQPGYREIHLSKVNSPEVKEKMKISHLGKVHTPERRANESKRSQKVWASEGFRESHSEGLKRMWRERTDEKKASFSAKMSGVNNPNAKPLAGLKLMDPDGTIHTTIECLTSFAKDHGLSPGHLRSLLQGKRKSHKGWKLAIT